MKIILPALLLLAGCFSVVHSETYEVAEVSQCVAVGNGWNKGYIQCGVRTTNNVTFTVNYIAQKGDLIRYECYNNRNNCHRFKIGNK